jgi:hypothetical protein
MESVFASSSSSGRQLWWLSARTPLLAALMVTSLAGCVVAPRYDNPDAPRHRRVYPAAPVPAPAATPAPMYFYPMRNQSEAQQDRDRYECYRWAVHQSGVDPGMTPVTGQSTEGSLPRTAEPDPRDGRSVVAGAATGAVAGAVLSGPRHTGQGAVMGAIFGAVLGAAVEESRARSVEQQQARTAPPPPSRPIAGSDNFRRAMSACMDARGYKVSTPLIEPSGVTPSAEQDRCPPLNRRANKAMRPDILA